jgi:NADP-dependent 3-hydroxy acid dehydrogenase YdfG
LKGTTEQREDLAFVGTVAIVTGASSGIGAATARELGRRGAKVVLAARRAEELEKQASAIRAAGDEAVAIVTDVADPWQLRSLVDQTVARFGRVDIVVNNAGANWHSPLASTRPDDLARLVQLNLIAAMQLTRATLPEMLARHDGSIVFVGSVSGRVAMEPLYSATKYGLRGFALALRRQLHGTGVTVSLVSPGKIRTEMTRHIGARLPGPEVLAAQIAEVIVHPRREVVVPRRDYIIIWLEQLAGHLADVAHRQRHWGEVTQEEPTAWTF